MCWNPSELCNDGVRRVWVTVDGGVARITPHTDRVGDRLHLSGTPGPLLGAFCSLWVGDAYDGRIWKMNPHTFEVVDRIKVPGGVYGIAAGEGGLWATGTG